MQDIQFSARTVPWMTLGTVIDASVPAAEAARLAGLDFAVRRSSVAYESAGGPSVETLDLLGRLERAGVSGKLRTDVQAAIGSWTRFPERDALVREDTDVALSIVSSTYETLQYADAFDFLDAVNPHIVAAGALRGGRQAFMVTRFDEGRDLKLLGEDEHDLYVVVRTSHDLTRATEASIMPLRHRCMNQLGLANFAVGAQMRWSVPHVRGSRAKIAQAQQAVLNLRNAATGLESFAERMAKVELELDEARALVTQALPDRPKRDETVGTILEAWQSSPFVGYAGTGWGLLNAVSEYFEWGRTGRNITDASRFTGALQGQTHRALNRTAALLLRRA